MYDDQRVVGNPDTSPPKSTDEQTFMPPQPVQGDLMPVISVEMASTSPEIKEELIRRLTKVSSEITGIPESSFFVFVKEYPPDAIGLGGTPLSRILGR